MFKKHINLQRSKRLTLDHIQVQSLLLILVKWLFINQSIHMIRTNILTKQLYLNLMLLSTGLAQIAIVLAELTLSFASLVALQKLLMLRVSQ